MHLGDGIIIFVIALILFGPKKLPEMARQVAKLMAEFRRASNEFKTQIDEELRSAEQADRQKQISAAAAASPAVTAPPTAIEPTILPPSIGEPVSQYAYYDPESQRPDRSLDSGSGTAQPSAETVSLEETLAPAANQPQPRMPQDSAAENETAVHASPAVNGNAFEGNGRGLAAIFAGRDRSTDITYLPEGPAAVLPGEAKTAADEASSEPARTNGGEFVEGSAAEQAQASVHHV
ncbi:MAG TPA: twin-arginine translocase TatA/TatE family subunit [Acidisarcina sp.]